MRKLLNKIFRSNVKLENIIKEKLDIINSLDLEIKENNLNLKILAAENIKKEEIITDKQCKLEHLSRELGDMNAGLNNISSKMENLMNENKRLKIKIEEYNKIEEHLNYQNSEYNRFKVSFNDQKNYEMNKMGETIRNFN